MSYWDISQMSNDLDLTSRAAACAAQEGIDDPRNWAADHMLTLAAEPGWADAWASAIAGGNESPGRDGAVITDSMVLSAVQAENSAGGG
jgi:hypothetical protein